MARHDHTFTCAGSRPARSAAFLTVATPDERLVGEEGMQHHRVEGTAREFQRLRPEGDDAQLDVFAERRIEPQDGIGALGIVVTEDGLTPEESAHHTGEFLHRSGADR